MSQPKTLGVRTLAAGVLAAVMSGRSLDEPLARARGRLSRDDDRSFLAALCFGALRRFFSNRALVRAMLERPGQQLQPQLEALLILGVEQLRATRVPPHAAVAETVAAARELDLASASGLVNALLRRFLREREGLLAGLSDKEARWDHPRWLIDELTRHYPEDVEAILTENNHAAPMWLRVNLARVTREEYAVRVAEACGVDVVLGRHAPGALAIDPAVRVERLPGFAAGDVAVQDQAAQLAAALLAPRPGERLLDACAAPGGKSAHLLESCAQIDLVAADVAAPRIKRLENTLARSGLTATVIQADWASKGPWRELAPFDKILVDAPCTGSGVIRRHPDMKLLRRATDSAKLAALQQTLLRNVWHILKPGGALLYATCSVLPTENDDVVDAFLTATDDADAVPLEPAGGWGRAMRHGRQVFPGGDASDGFYYAYISKRP